MQNITPCLWFDHQAEEAVRFYTSIFPDASVGAMMRYDEASAKVSGMPQGSVLTIEFTILGQKFTALNGGPVFKFTEAISFIVSCETQGEVDMYWRKLAEGGVTSQCGWLKDKYGVSWQIVPAILDQLLRDADETRAKSVMKAMLEMQKLDIAGLKRAYERTE